MRSGKRLQVLGLLAAVALLAWPSGHGLLGPSVASAQGSLNEAGAGVPNYQTGQIYELAQGGWTVPNVKYEPKSGQLTNGLSNQVLAIWVGIGGWWNSYGPCSVNGQSGTCAGPSQPDLIQLGTYQTVQPNGSVTTQAFYELRGQTGVKNIKQISIAPGDHVFAQLQCHNTTGGPCPVPGSNAIQTWTLSMKVVPLNVKKKTQTWSQSFNYQSSQLSVEWIAEAPLTVNNLGQSVFYAFPLFSSFTMDTTNGANGSSPILPAGPTGTLLQWPNTYMVFFTTNAYSACQVHAVASNSVTISVSEPVSGSCP
jgi:hypothetical protein